MWQNVNQCCLLFNLQCIIFVTAIITSYNLKNWSVQNICIWILSVNMGELHQICKEQVIFRKTICLQKGKGVDPLATASFSDQKQAMLGPNVFFCTFFWGGVYCC